ncbi:EAL domain-containing protein [Cytobacillus suaedae]|nr:EAL domain-containing protein [Cytobacillus suaedae]
MSGEQTRYSRLATITKLINTKLDLKEVLQHVVTAISEEIVKCDSVGIYLPQADGTYRGYVSKPEVINGMTIDMHVVDPSIDFLAKEVIETQEAIYIPDTSRDDRPDRRAVEAFQIKSLLGVPISYENELFGLVFLFDYGIPMNLTIQEIQTVEAFVNMAAVALRNANDLSRKENLLSEKQLLLDVTRDLSMCSTLQEVMDTCFSYIGRVLKNPNIGAHLLEPVAKKGLKPAKLSKDSDWKEDDWKKTHNEIMIDYREDALFQEVIRTKQAVLVPDVSKDPRPNHEACRNFGIKGIYMMPLVAMGEVLGTIPVVNLVEPGQVYPEASMQLAQSIADATALTLSSMLYMEKQELIIAERTSEITKKNEELKSIVNELQRLSREKELILNSAGEGIFGLNLDGKITFCNPSGAKMLGYQMEELIGLCYDTIFSRKKKGKSSCEVSFETYLQKNHKKYDMDERFYKKDGTHIPVEYVIASIKEENQIVGYVVTFKDVSSRKSMEEKIKYHAYYDTLTELPNRILFKDRLNQGLTYASRNNKKLAVLVLDLDRFKVINDTLGHNAGDQLLQEVARRLTACSQIGDTVSRQGGDEFTIILPSIDYEEQVISYAEQVLEAFVKPFRLNGEEVFIKTSIGISLYPGGGENTDDLLKNADTAMYKAKEFGGNNYQFYTNGMENRTFESVKLENDLYRALENQEFSIYYQPQVNTETGKMFGVEALLRWNHPVRGLVSPAEFIPMAEETGLIIPIGEWVLRHASKQVKQWQEQRHGGLSLSVNLSVRQFEQRNLVSMVQQVLKETGFRPELLELELTENIIVKNTEATMKTMDQLKGLGINISIDDFGTGYSSLGYLKNFPIKTLKIDKSFIDDVMNDTNNAAITNTIITLGQNMNLNVIAEGVETKEQVEFLSSKGCRLVQGYFFSPPLKAEDLVEKYLSKEEVLNKA